MNVFYENNYYLRISDFDLYGKVRASSILDLFQDVAATHANLLGIGFDTMLEHETIWVLTKVKFEIIKQPDMYQTVHVKTWPLEPEKISFRREYLITDLDGNVLIKGSSEWVVMHSIKRRLVPAANAFPIKEGFITEKMFDEKLRKISDFEAADKIYTVTTAFSHCDVNGHVNNTVYADFVADALDLKECENIKIFQIDYNQEVVSGTKLHIHTCRTENEIFAKGISENGYKKFCCHIELDSAG